MQKRNVSSRRAAQSLFEPRSDSQPHPLDPFEPRLPFEVHLSGLSSTEARALLERRWGLRWLQAPNGMRVGHVALPPGWWLQFDDRQPSWMNLMDSASCVRARVLDRTMVDTHRPKAYIEPLARYHVTIDFDDSANERSQIVAHDRETRTVIRRSAWLDGAPSRTEYCRQQMISDMEIDFPGFDDPLRYWTDLHIALAAKKNE